MYDYRNCKESQYSPPESKVLVEKAVSMARPYNAKVSLIHVDVNYSDLYTGLIDVNL
ncbi:hypothetical protein ACSLOB_22070, partial [Escherichia coli]